MRANPRGRFEQPWHGAFGPALASDRRAYRRESRMQLLRADLYADLAWAMRGARPPIDPRGVPETLEVAHECGCVLLDGRVDRQALAVSGEMAVAADVREHPDQ